MDTKYESILLSKPFKFVVGPEKKQFIMHEAAITRLSKTLDRLLNGGMKESRENCVCWEDIDEKTFLRFGEWAYTRDYKPEEPEILLDFSKIARPDDILLKVVAKVQPIVRCLITFNEVSENNGKRECCLGRKSHNYGHATNVSCCRCTITFSTNYCNTCRSALYALCSSCRNIPDQGKRRAMIEKFNNSSAYAPPIIPFTPRKNTESCEDYSEVFLSHARLYVLADKYDIKELRDLCAHKLWVTLKEFTLYPERMGDIVGLVRYSFQNTLEGDKLRTLLKDFCACIVEDLCKGQGFQDLIYEAPEFACELIKEMSTRLD
ncbi:hypothetical protein GGI35DRAFT_487482 [Trichoderma velutinum]